MFKLNLLGSPHIQTLESEPKRFELEAKKPVYLLIYLAYSGEWLEREKLEFLFWPDASTNKGQQNLRRLIYRTKEYDFSSTLEVKKTRLRWQVPTDVAEFKETVANQKWAKAVELYSGRFLDNLNPKNEASFEAWLEQERADLESVWRNAVHKHVENLEASENSTEACTLLYQLLEREPLAEDVLQRYLRHAFLIGEYEKALTTFEAFQNLLKTELDLEPLDETIEIIEAIKNRGEGELGKSLFKSQSTNTKEARVQQTIPLTVLRPPKLVGRADSIQKIRNASTIAIFIAGDAGVGKSRLMAELAPNALRLSCQEGSQNIPYYPVIRLIRSFVIEGIETPNLKHYLDDLARLVPEAVPNLKPGPVDPEIGRGRLFEALSLYLEAVVSRKELSGFHLCADDLQWADSSTLDFLIYLVNKQNIKLLGAYRIHEVTEGLKKLMQGLNSSQLLTEVKLEPLTQPTIQEFIASLMGKTVGPPVFSEWLSKATAGNPMFMLETLKSLFETGTLQAQDSLWQTDIDEVTQNYSEIEMPTVVQDVIQRRIEKLKPETQRVLQVAAVLNQGFTPELVSQISGFSEWTVLDAFENAEQTAVIEQDHFQHDLLRQTVYNRLPKNRKRLLHLKTAEVLESIADSNLVTGSSFVTGSNFVAGSNLVIEPSLIAHHWFNGGELNKAIECWIDAAVLLRSKGLLIEAAQFLESKESYLSDDNYRWKINSDLGVIYRDLADFDKVKSLLEPVFEYANDEVKIEACSTLAGVLMHEGKLEQANQIIEQGFSLVQTVKNEKLEFDLIGTAAVLKNYMGDSQAALDLLQPVLSKLRKGPASIELTTSILNVAALLDQLGRHEEALPLHTEALARSKSSGDKSRHVDVSLNLLYCYMDLKRTAEGILIAEEALGLGHLEGTDMLRNNLAAAYMEIGKLDNAQSHYEILVETTPHSTLLCVAWSRLAKLYSSQDKIYQALDNTIKYAKKTEIALAHAVMLTSVYLLGSKDHIASVESFVELLNLDELPQHIKIDLEEALAKNL